MPATGEIPEIAISAAWREQRFSEPLQTRDGQPLSVVHRGIWTHGFGPDFQDALLLFDGTELRAGSVEVHRRTSGWTAHGHHLDPRYDTVVLHVVLDDDGAETRRRDGAIVPVLALRDRLTELTVPDPSQLGDWSRFGGEVCAPELTATAPAEVRRLLWGLGDSRLAAKAAQFEALLTDLPPGEVLYRAVWDGLGYSANRQPMTALAAALPLAALEGALSTSHGQERTATAQGLLFGVAGFLPLAPADAALAGLTPAAVAALEAAWDRFGSPWCNRTLPPTAWTRARVRPANHPAARLAAGAAILAAATGGLATVLMAPLRAGTDPVSALRRLAEDDGTSRLGADRTVSIVTNAVIPFALALAAQTSDPELADAAARAWEQVPAGEANHRSRRALRQIAGDVRLRGLGTRGQQGLIHLDATLCAPRRCYDCPIAHRVLADGRAVSAGADSG